MRTSPIWKKNLCAILNEHSCYQQLFLPSPSFCSWEMLTESAANLGFGRQGLCAITFQYSASHITDHGKQIIPSSVALPEVGQQPPKSARCRILLQPGANWAACAGAGRAGSQESIPLHTHSGESGERGAHTRLSAASGNTPQKLLLGTSSETLLEAASGNAVVSVNSVDWALLFPKPRETVPF